MTTCSLTVPLELDDHGMLGRECREGCFQYFKVDGAHFEAFQGEELWCPYCGFQSEHSDFLTTDQLEYLKSVALKHALEGPLGRELKKLERKPDPRAFISLGISVKLPNIQVRRYVEKEIERKTDCEKCLKRYAVYGASYYCPFCGPREPFPVFGENVNTIRNLITLEATFAANKEVSDALRQTGVTRKLVEKGIDMAVTAFETFCKSKLVPVIMRNHPGYDEEMVRRKIGNAFQNVRRGEQILQSETSLQYGNYIDSREIDFLNKRFEKRHVLVHSAGFIDKRYCDLTGEALSKIGQKVVVSKDEVNKMLTILEKLVQALNPDIS